MSPNFELEIPKFELAISSIRNKRNPNKVIIAVGLYRGLYSDVFLDQIMVSEFREEINICSPEVEDLCKKCMDIILSRKDFIRIAIGKANYMGTPGYKKYIDIDLSQKTNRDLKILEKVLYFFFNQLPALTKEKHYAEDTLRTLLPIPTGCSDMPLQIQG